MKILITGISGFVARHYVEYLSEVEKSCTVLGLYNRHLPSFSEDEYLPVECKFRQLNLTDKQRVKNVILNFNPDYILHLASRSSVAFSWQKPGELITENTQIFLNLVEALRETGSRCKMLSVGSAEEYGHVEPEDLPLTESHPTRPVSPYGAARVLQNNLVGIYSKNYGLNLVHTRSFNHIGPYQNENFVIGSFIKQISEQIREGKKEITLVVGDIEVVRDFTDVRDVVKAYHALLMKGRKGETYNVCSNRRYKLRELIELFSRLTGRRITTVIDPNNFRPTENKMMVGSYDKLKAETGWEPVIPIEDSLADLLVYWKKRVAVLND